MEHASPATSFSQAAIALCNVHHRPIGSYQWLCMVFYGLQWLLVEVVLMVIVVIGGYQWLCMVIYGYQWLCMFIYGYQ